MEGSSNLSSRFVEVQDITDELQLRRFHVAHLLHEAVSRHLTLQVEPLELEQGCFDVLVFL